MNIFHSRGSTGYSGSIHDSDYEFICLVEQKNVKRKKQSRALKFKNKEHTTFFKPHVSHPAGHVVQ